MQKLTCIQAPEQTNLQLSLMSPYLWLPSVADEAQWNLVTAQTGPRQGEIPTLSWPANLFSQHNVQMAK